MKYVLITGGVLSGIGKGMIASSTGLILKSMGYRVTSIKIDPYLNIDAGTMSPFEHGEVFVLDDGGEVDLDLGNYERFIGVKLARDNNITTGKIYNHIIEKERRGEFLGKTVQIIPHVTDEVQTWIERVANVPADGQQTPPDICVIELGGTIGDIESAPFVEALRQLQFRQGNENFCLIHVTLVPVLGVVGEQKTKPSQQSVRELRALGLSPDVVVCRSSLPLAAETAKKISLFCQVPLQNVVGVHDVSNIYRIPLLLQKQGLPSLLLARLQLPVRGNVPASPPRGLDAPAPSTSIDDEVPYWLASWREYADRVDRMNGDVRNAMHIAMVGKYTGLTDSYLSVVKALEHASVEVNRKVIIDWVEATNLEPLPAPGTKSDRTQEKHDEAWNLLRTAHGILVPGGFGDRGIEGMILAANYARTSAKPYFGICLGMQIAVIEFARNVLGWAGANSEEFDRNADKQVVVFMPEISKTHMGATMRLGSRSTVIRDLNSHAAKLYGVANANAEGTAHIDERHRHRYEVNPDLAPLIHQAGLRFVGHDSSKQRMEIAELDGHPYYVGVQYHPEFKSRPEKPSPPFVGLVLACWDQELKKTTGSTQLNQLMQKWHLA